MTEASETCTGCGERPARKEITFGEVFTKTHFCEPCWDEKLKILHSGQVEQQAQAQYDKLMRDLEDGVDASEAWERKNEKDD